jgi:UrcA family protein
MNTFINRAMGSRAKYAMLALAAASLAAMGTASAATVDSDAPSLVVHYSSETLATEAGVHSLYHRLVQASRQVCPDPSIRDLGADAKVRQCRDQAIARAIREINNPQLAALYATSARNG